MIKQTLHYFSGCSGRVPFKFLPAQFFNAVVLVKILLHLDPSTSLFF
jgi:hypothetical protein